MGEKRLVGSNKIPAEGP